MLFKENEQFNVQEQLLLKIMLSGVQQTELLELLPHQGSVISQIITGLNSKRIDSNLELEAYLRSYEATVLAKHNATRMEDYKEAARLRDIESKYADISYQWLFTDDFSDHSANRSYIRYTSEQLIEELEGHLMY